MATHSLVQLRRCSHMGACLSFMGFPRCSNDGTVGHAGGPCGPEQWLFAHEHCHFNVYPSTQAYCLYRLGQIDEVREGGTWQVLCGEVMAAALCKLVRHYVVTAT